MTALLRLVVVLLLSLAAVVAVSAQAQGNLRVALQLEPPNLDPTSGAAVAIDEVVYATIFEGLVRADTDGSIRPLLAESWTVSSDGLVHDFKLRGGVRFHDGRPLTEDDVIFSLLRISAKTSSNAQAQAFSRIAAVTSPAPGRVRIRLKAPDANFLTLLTLGDAVIVPRHAAKTLATDPIGTGPFRFADWRRGSDITLVRNPNYWGKPARLARLTFRFIADPSAAYAAVKAGDVDLFPDYPAPETFGQLRSDPRLKLTVGPTEGEVILSMNQRQGPLANLAVRRAIAHALDRRAIIDGAMFGYGVPIGSHFPPQSPDYIDLTGRYPHDVEAGRRLLAEAGYADGFTLRLKLPPQSYARRTGEIIAAQLAKLKIKVRIQNLEWPGWLDEVFARHDYDLTIVNHAEPFDYDIYGRTGYYFGYDSPAYRALLARLQTARDPATRHGLLAEIQRTLADDAVNGFLFQFPRLGVQDARLLDVWINTPNQAIDFATVSFAGAAGGDDASSDKSIASGGWGIPALLLLLIGVAAALWRFGLPYVASRLGSFAMTLVAATVVIFALIQVVPGDPAAYMMGLGATPQAIAALHAELGLTGSLPERYFAWVGGLLHGDFGISYVYRVPVAGLLADRFALSLPLAGLATALSILVGVPAGYWAALRRGSAVDVVISWLARLGIALPSFWLAMLLVLLFAVGLGWVEAGGFPGWSAGTGPALRALALPMVALALPQAAILGRVTRASLLDTLDEDYVRTARAKGLGRARAAFRHALPNALGPVLTVLGLQFPFLLAGGAIIENIFFLPGLGRLVIQAIAQRDLIVVQSVVVVLVAVTVLVSLLIDMLAAAIDPRLREGERQ
jgi:ABC-type transport system substrate-binding protein/ABC-type dipeptide/oligopeptide/nickel transport system permease component